jgi:hypothetical protein
MALVGGLVGSVVVGLQAADAVPSTAALQLGPPTGEACAGVGLSQGPTTFLADGLPVVAWNGVPLLGLIDGPAALGRQGLLGPSCGDLTHGATETGLAGTVHTGFLLGSGGTLGVATTASMQPANALMTLFGRSAFSYAEADQDAVATPSLAAGDQSFTISVTYTVLSVGTNAPIGSGPNTLQSSVDAAIGYTSGAQAPACNGQPISADTEGVPAAFTPGTYTATFGFSCPAGQTLTESTPITVQLALIQVGTFQAGATSASWHAALAAAPGAVTLTVAG